MNQFKYVKKCFSVLLVFVGIYHLKAQNITDYNRLPIDTFALGGQSGQLVDSVRERILSSKEDSDKVWQYYILSGQNTFNNPDTAIMYAQKGLDIAKKINYEPGYFYCGMIKSWTLTFSGNYTGSLSLEFNALKELEKTGNYYRLAWTFDNIGFDYLMGGDARMALRYIYRAWETIQPHYLEFPASAEAILRNTGEAYEGLNQLDSALFFMQKSYALELQIHYDYNPSLRKIADIYSKKGRYDTAIVLYRKACYMANLNTVLYDVVQIYNGMAGIFRKTGRVDSALFYANKTISEGKAFPGVLVQAYDLLTQIYKEEHAFDSAFKYQQLSFSLRDSVFNDEKSKQLQTFSFNEQQHQQEIKQKLQEAALQYRNRLNIYFLVAGLVILMIVAGGLWRRNVFKQKAYALLEKQKQEIDFQKTKVEKTLEELKSTQVQLIQSEKMASLGELTAGIAHEIQNPLNFVNNFSEVNKELLEELEGERSKVRSERDEQLENDIIKDLKENQEKINHHGKRADAIVKGMLQHSRASSGQRELTDINKLVDEYLRLSYHGFRAKDKGFNAEYKTDFDETIGKINVVPQDIGRVLLNLFNNAFYAVNEKKKSGPLTLPINRDRLKGGTDKSQNEYTPLITVRTKLIPPLEGKREAVEIRVSDNGNGIPQNIVDKIFQPFFTTKPTGQGTGLGLSLAYDIIKAHSGELTVNTKEGEGSEFVIVLSV
jgi:signal transduction histidine kinase